MGRYTLILDGNPVEKYTKVNLREIDLYTINFNTTKELIDDLNRKGITDLAELKITYKAYSKEKRLSVALDSKNVLKQVKCLSEGKLDYSDSTFKKYTRKFCEQLLRDKDFFKLCLRSNLLNSKIKDYIELMVYEKNVFYENKLIEHLGNYLQFRNVIFILSEYEGYKQALQSKQEKIEEPEENKGYLYDENFTQEEIEAYQDYMDNLPDGLSAHEDKYR